MKRRIIIFALLAAMMFFTTGCTVMGLKNSVALSQAESKENAYQHSEHKTSKKTKKIKTNSDNTLEKAIQSPSDLESKKQKIEPVYTNSSLEGTWQGSAEILNTNFNIKLELDDDDKFEIELTSPEYSDDELEISGKYKVSNDVINLKVKDVDKKLEGFFSENVTIPFDFELSSDKNTLTLKDTDNNLSFINEPITLTK